MTPVEFLSKKVTKKIGGSQKKIDIASSQGYTIRNILHYDHDECPCFDEGNLTKHKKTQDTDALRANS